MCNYIISKEGYPPSYTRWRWRINQHRIWQIPLTWQLAVSNSMESKECCTLTLTVPVSYDLGVGMNILLTSVCC